MGFNVYPLCFSLALVSSLLLCLQFYLLDWEHLLWAIAYWKYLTYLKSSGTYS
jgi:hypothetical protein